MILFREQHDLQSENCCSQCDTKQTSCDDWIAAQHDCAAKSLKIAETKQLISSLDILLVSLSNCVSAAFISFSEDSRYNQQHHRRQKDPHAKDQSSCHVGFFFFSATSKLSHSLGVGPVRRYDSLHVEGETRNHGNRSVMSSSAHSCVRTCRNQRLLPTLLFTYLYLILVVAITVSETEFTVKNARLQLTKNKMALG